MAPDNRSLTRRSEDRRVEELERRMAMLDGNSIDRAGGRVGRLEATLNRLQWMMATTLLASIGALLMQLIKHIP